MATKPWNRKPENGVDSSTADKLCHIVARRFGLPARNASRDSRLASRDAKQTSRDSRQTPRDARQTSRNAEQTPRDPRLVTQIPCFLGQNGHNPDNSVPNVCHPATQPQFTLNNSVPGELGVNLPAAANAKAHHVRCCIGTGPMIGLGITPARAVVQIGHAGDALSCRRITPGQDDRRYRCGNP